VSADDGVLAPPGASTALATSRLTLRPLRDDDAASLFAIFSDPRVMRYWSSAPWSDVERARETIAADAAAMRAGDYVRLGLEARQTGELIGTCTLFNFMPQCRRGELGYALRSTQWGCGYMHEALTALLAFAFEALDLNRVEADVDPRNFASVKSLRRLGFREEGCLRERWIVAGEVSDSAFYGLLRRDWKQRRAGRARCISDDERRHGRHDARDTDPGSNEE
jgi:RimJ/RimL family protein N-acetyltransferase